MGRVSSNKDIESLARLLRDQGWTVEPTNGNHVKWTNPEGRSFNGPSSPSDYRAVVNLKGTIRQYGGITEKDAWRREKRRRRDAELEALKASEPDTPTKEVPVDRDLTLPPPERERINCPDCPEFFWNTQPHMLDRHLYVTHGKVSCPHCGKMMLSTSLDQHVRESCPAVDEAKRAAAVQEAREKRASLQLGDNPPEKHPCPDCGEEFPTQRAMVGHRTGKHMRGEKFPCPHNCGMVTDKTHMAKHVAACPNNPRRKVPCPACGKVMSMDYVSRHLAEKCQVATASHVAQTASATPAPPAPAPTPIVQHTLAHHVSAPSGTDDADLFAVLELILGVSIPVHALGAVNEWIEATRKLIRVVEGD